MEKLTPQEMKKLSRKELLELMLLQAEELDKLRKEKEELTEKKQQKDMAASRAGTLAEASVLVSNLLAEAEKASQDYKINVERMCKDTGSITQAKLAESQRMLDQASREANDAHDMLLADAQKEADSIRGQAMTRRDELQLETNAYWAEISRKMEQFYQERPGLREMVDSLGGGLSVP